MRKKVIEDLIFIKDNLITNLPNLQKSLSYAINSLRTDELYNLMYEDLSNVYTKEEVLELLEKIETNMTSLRFGQPIRKYVVDECLDCVETEINRLKEK